MFCAFSTVQLSSSVSSIRALVCDIFWNIAIAPGIYYSFTEITMSQTPPNIMLSLIEKETSVVVLITEHNLVRCVPTLLHVGNEFCVTLFTF